jgi:hypothetical protein
MFSAHRTTVAFAQKGAALTQEHWHDGRWLPPSPSLDPDRPRHLGNPLNRKHHVHSKVMCWKTVDSALILAEHLGRNRPDWKILRDTIAEEILQGWNARRRHLHRL